MLNLKSENFYHFREKQNTTKQLTMCDQIRQASKRIKIFRTERKNDGSRSPKPNRAASCPSSQPAENEKEIYKCFQTFDLDGKNMFFFINSAIKSYLYSGGSKAAPQARAPLQPKFFSLSRSFWENLTKSYVGAPWRFTVPSYRESWICPCFNRA